MRLGETPVPIPNTKVKTQTADGTILETIWESRWLPDYIKSHTVTKVFIQGIEKQNKSIDILNDCMAVAGENQICFLPGGGEELPQSVP